MKMISRVSSIKRKELETLFFAKVSQWLLYIKLRGVIDSSGRIANLKHDPFMV